MSLGDWDELIPPARRAGVLARLALAADRAGGLDAVPEQPRQHLRSALIAAEKQRRDIEFELDRLAETLKGTIGRIVLLKGAAYLAAGLPAAEGRIFGDIDILVPKETLPRVEAVLDISGWRFGEMAEYDRSYYRRWMHQIPPLVHGTRGSLLDVHHTIVARTRRLQLDAAELFRAAVDIPGRPGFAVLAPADMVLHSAAHLLNEAEFDRGLRDLDDLHRLLCHFGRDPGFFPSLLERAAKLDLRRPLYYALRYTTRYLGTPVPPEICNAAELAPPNRVLRAVMDALFEQALLPRYPSGHSTLRELAGLFLYMRAHYLLMPMHILVPHLLRKAYMRRAEQQQQAGVV
ncbi:MAG TPA: nucleotidyltransferase family protein [Stellaceae bacterium]|nr:nucleotidyltransferase family protein [Stellaceae bacterium]